MIGNLVKAVFITSEFYEKGKVQDVMCGKRSVVFSVWHDIMKTGFIKQVIASRLY